MDIPISNLFPWIEIEGEPTNQPGKTGGGSNTANHPPGREEEQEEEGIHPLLLFNYVLIITLNVTRRQARGGRLAFLPFPPTLSTSRSIDLLLFFHSPHTPRMASKKDIKAEVEETKM